MKLSRKKFHCLATLFYSKITRNGLHEGYNCDGAVKEVEWLESQIQLAVDQCLDNTCDVTKQLTTTTKVAEIS